MAHPNQDTYRETVHKFLVVYRHLRQYSRQRHKEGISGRKISALRHLEEAGPCTVGQVRDYLYVSDSSASELIAQLEKKGYVTRTRSHMDNRVVIVALTPTGQGLLDRTPLGGFSLLRRRLEDLSEDKLLVINQAMTEILTLLEIDHEHS